MDELDRLPEKGMSVETVLKEAKSILALGDGDWKTGSESGTVYNGDCYLSRCTHIIRNLTLDLQTMN